MRINVERYMFKMIDVLDRLEYFAETAPDRLAFKSVNVKSATDSCGKNRKLFLVNSKLLD